MSQRKIYDYWLETQRSDGSWHKLTGAYGQSGYVQGWLHGIKSYYPSPAARIMRSSFSEGEIPEQIQIRGKSGRAHTNQGAGS